MASEDSQDLGWLPMIHRLCPSCGREPFLLVFRTRRIVTAHISTLEGGTDMNEYRRDTRVFQHIAGCAPYRHRFGGQLPLPAKGIPTLGTLLPPTRSYEER